MSSPGRVKLKVTFGFMPSYSSTGKGLGVDGVRTEGPAGKAGLVKGDIILEINGEAIKDIYGYMEILEKLKPGESSEVKVLRNNNEITLRINH
jgi:S1-C subfamily serine protease